MKSLQNLFTACLILFSPVMFSYNVDDSATYELEDGGRFISRGNGVIKIEKKTDSTYEYGEGYILRMDYDMTARLSGRQWGYIEIFVPGNTLDEMHSLSREKQYGAFTLAKTGIEVIDGKTCNVITAENVVHPYSARKGEAKVLKVVNNGSLKVVNDIKVQLKTHNVPSEKVLKALKIYIEGKVSMGLKFKATFKKI